MVKNKRNTDANSLLILVLDVSPLAWGERDIQRTAQDKSRVALGKRSVGPAVLEEALEATEAFASAFCSIEHDAGLVLIAVADNETAVVYPRSNDISEWMLHPETYLPDIRKMKEHLTVGVHELLLRAASKAQYHSDASSRQAAMAAAFSNALCIINRFLVAARVGGVSALRNETHLNRNDDQGVIALMDGKAKSKPASKKLSGWSPRIFLVQASDDRSRDYNAFMNCAFAAVKQSIVVDGCFLSAKGNHSSSAFLEQACDLTGGVFLSPSGTAQVGGALTEVLHSVFLADVPSRCLLNLPAINKVDFRARCFETAELVDLAYVCNQCLSIFQKQPKNYCPTCQAKIVVDSKRVGTTEI
jgi:transcription initiation factor TFIIH subunit 3